MLLHDEFRDSLLKAARNYETQRANSWFLTLSDTRKSDLSRLRATIKRRYEHAIDLRTAVIAFFENPNFTVGFLKRSQLRNCIMLVINDKKYSPEALWKSHALQCASLLKISRVRIITMKRETADQSSIVERQGKLILAHEREIEHLRAKLRTTRCRRRRPARAHKVSGLKIASRLSSSFFPSSPKEHDSASSLSDRLASSTMELDSDSSPSDSA